MAQIEIQEGSLYYEVCGAGPPLVLAHGIGGNHAIWYQQIPQLSKSFRVINFDHRGFGNSVDGGNLGRAAFVEDLRRLLDHIGVDRASLVAQSMGGGTCLGFTAAYPDRVSALVLCDTLHGFVEPPDVAEIMSASRAATDGLSQLERVLGDVVREGDPARAALYSQLNSFNTANRHNLAGKFAPLCTPAELAATRVPTLFLVGEHDVLFPAAAVAALHAQVPGSEFVEVAGAGHSVFFEQPGTFNNLVLTFLERALARDTRADENRIQ